MKKKKLIIELDEGDIVTSAADGSITIRPGFPQRMINPDLEEDEEIALARSQPWSRSDPVPPHARPGGYSSWMSRGFGPMGGGNGFIPPVPPQRGYSPQPSSFGGQSGPMDRFGNFINAFPHELRQLMTCLSMLRDHVLTLRNTEPAATMGPAFQPLPTHIEALPEREDGREAIPQLWLLMMRTGELRVFEQSHVPCGLTDQVEYAICVDTPNLVNSLDRTAIYTHKVCVGASSVKPAGRAAREVRKPSPTLMKLGIHEPAPSLLLTGPQIQRLDAYLTTDDEDKEKLFRDLEKQGAVRTPPLGSRLTNHNLSSALYVLFFLQEGTLQEEILLPNGSFIDVPKNVVASIIVEVDRGGEVEAYVRAVGEQSEEGLGKAHAVLGVWRAHVDNVMYAPRDVLMKHLQELLAATQGKGNDFPAAGFCNVDIPRDAIEVLVFWTANEDVGYSHIAKARAWKLDQVDNVIVPEGTKYVVRYLVQANGRVMRELFGQGNFTMEGAGDRWSEEPTLAQKVSDELLSFSNPERWVLLKHLGFFDPTNELFEELSVDKTMKIPFPADADRVVSFIYSSNLNSEFNLTLSVAKPEERVDDSVPISLEGVVGVIIHTIKPDGSVVRKHYRDAAWAYGHEVNMIPLTTLEAEVKTEPEPVVEPEVEAEPVVRIETEWKEDVAMQDVVSSVTEYIDLLKAEAEKQGIVWTELLDRTVFHQIGGIVKSGELLYRGLVPKLMEVLNGVAKSADAVLGEVVVEQPAQVSVQKASEMVKYDFNQHITVLNEVGSNYQRSNTAPLITPPDLQLTVKEGWTIVLSCYRTVNNNEGIIDKVDCEVYKPGEVFVFPVDTKAVVMSKIDPNGDVHRLLYGQWVN